MGSAQSFRQVFQRISAARSKVERAPLLSKHISDSGADALGCARDQHAGVAKMKIHVVPVLDAVDRCALRVRTLLACGYMASRRTATPNARGGCRDPRRKHSGHARLAERAAPPGRAGWSADA